MANVFITGIAGFIGSSLAHRLVKDGHTVWGIDSFNDFYDVELKRSRARNLLRDDINVTERNLNDIYFHDLLYADEFGDVEADYVIHLAAYAGVRHSMKNTELYVENNILGTEKLIKICSSNKLDKHPKIIYASTSCVMAGNPLPWKEDEPVGHQLNPYGWTKRVNECQFKNSGLQNVGLRFFTVYGPWGRPDMALFSFTEKMLRDEPIELFNNGDMIRDWTYIDDIVNGVCLVLDKYDTIPNGEILNIGRGKQVPLTDFVECLEHSLGRKAQIIFRPKHPADTLETWADTSKLQALGYHPHVDVAEGIEQFVNWFRTYYRT